MLESDRRQRSPRRMMPRRTDKLSDEQLMARLDGPEVEAALSKLYDRYSRTVYGVGIKILGDRSSAEEVVDESWLSWRVSRALEVLDGPHKEVINLAYFEGLSQREISQRTGVPLGTVKTRTA